MTVDIKQLRTLVAISETGSVTRAAQLLHLVQPAVSRQLRLLEEDIGVSLFTRDRRGMALTPAGQVLVDHARRALRELDHARSEIDPNPQAVSGSVTVGLLPSTSTLLSVPLVEALRDRYPLLTLRISVGYGGYLQQWLENGDVDVALLYDPKPSALLDIEPLVEEGLCLVGGPNAGLRMDEPAALRSLAEKPMILPNQPHGLRALVEHACAVAKLQLHIVAETNDMNVQIQLAGNGFGFTILPAVAVSALTVGGIITAAPVRSPHLRRKIVLARSVARRSSNSVRCAAAELRLQISASIAAGRWTGATWLGGLATGGPR